MVIADNVAQAAAAGAVAGATSVALITLGIELRRRSKARKRPPEDLITLLQWLYTSFGEILYHNDKEIHTGFGIKKGSRKPTAWKQFLVKSSTKSYVSA